MVASGTSRVPCLIHFDWYNPVSLLQVFFANLVHRLHELYLARKGFVGQLMLDRSRTSLYFIAGITSILRLRDQKLFVFLIHFCLQYPTTL